MNHLIAKAEYALALSNNSITDEIRNNFFSVLSFKRDLHLDAFILILENCINKVLNNSLTMSEAYILLQ